MELIKSGQLWVLILTKQNKIIKKDLKKSLCLTNLFLICVTKLRTMFHSPVVPKKCLFYLTTGAHWPTGPCEKFRPLDHLVKLGFGLKMTWIYTFWKISEKLFNSIDWTQVPPHLHYSGKLCSDISRPTTHAPSLGKWLDYKPISCFWINPEVCAAVHL